MASSLGPPRCKAEPSTLEADDFFSSLLISDPPDIRRNAPSNQHPLVGVKLEQPEPSHFADNSFDAEYEADVNHRVKAEPPEDRGDFIAKKEEYHDDQEDDLKPQQRLEVGNALSRKRKKLLPGPTFRKPSHIRTQHRYRLEALLRSFMSEQRWEEAAAVLSVLLKGAPHERYMTEDVLRRYHTVAMELHRRCLGSGEWKYEMWVKQIYELWMSKLSGSRVETKKKNVLLLELALFYFMRGNMDEAYNMMQCVIQDPDLASEPYVNLLFGMILYQHWYSSLPEEFKIKDLNKRMPVATSDVLVDSYRETEINESSNNHYAAVTENAKFSSRYVSESSFGIGKVLVGCKHHGSKADLDIASQPREFLASISSDMNEQKSGPCYPEGNAGNNSIFLARGLDTSLLPIQLDQLSGDIEQIVKEYRKLADGYYYDAVYHLRLALHSTHPVYAALLPLIQLLLLGDRVEEAFTELDKSCKKFDTALPFRLMARLLECFQHNKVIQICSFYEGALKRDPTSNYSLESLVKMHKSGNYSTMMMFEMIALHLDAADGQCGIWEEFASCFLQLQNIAESEFEDCTSEALNRWNSRKVQRVSSSKVPTALMEGSARGSWKLRLAWWKRRHFSSSLLPEQSGDRKMLCFKASCVSHLYGPTYEYVIRVCKYLREDNDHYSILSAHMQRAMNLIKHL